MATGVVMYWNGDSGWIKQTGVDDLPTAFGQDVLFTIDAVVSGAIQLGSSVTFTSVSPGQATGIAADNANSP